MPETAFRTRPSLLAMLPSALILATTPLAAGPTVVPTAEGQIGGTPGVGDKVVGTRLESVRGMPGEVLLGGFFSLDGIPVPPPEMKFFSDLIHDNPMPASIGDIPVAFTDPNVVELPPGSARARNATDDGDFVAFSFAADGAMPDTLTVRIVTFDELGSTLVTVPIEVQNTLPFPDPSFSKTGVAIDEQGRATVVYSEFPLGGPPMVKADRIDGVTGMPINTGLMVNALANDAAVALLDPAGNRLIVAMGDGGIKGNFIDFSGATPAVLPQFPISTTPAAVANVNPAVAADPATGVSTVVWEHLTGVVGNPVDIRGRRFDAMGNPVGNDFVVNSMTANAQGQAAVAYGSGGESAVVWAGDNAPGDELDVFAQAYDADGNPIGGEIRVNSTTSGIQDRPAVRFLPEPDSQGRPQFVVAWRDVGEPGGGMPVGTGTSYKCFSIEGLGPPTEIFADGFESGDTSSWSDTQP